MITNSRSATSLAPIGFGIPLYPYARWQGLPELAAAVQLADELGFDSVQLPEHIMTPVGPDIPEIGGVWYEVFVLASHLATLTRRIRMLFAVTLVPYRHPLHLAKLAATLDVVSAGRVTLGVGVGWLEREFDALNVPFEARGALMDESLAALRALWTEDEPAFRGRYVNFDPLIFLPRCVQQPHVPLWIGGDGPAAERRVVEFGDGWMPMGVSLEDRRDRFRRIQERAAAGGRDPEALVLSASLSIGTDPASARASSHVLGRASTRTSAGTSDDEVLEQVARRREAGVSHISLSFPWETPEDYRERLEWFAERILPKI